MSSISSTIIVSNSSGLYVKSYYPNYNHALTWNSISKFALSSKCKNQTSLKSIKRKSFVVYANFIPGPDSLPATPPPSGSMMNWILGIVVSLVLHSFGSKWGPIGLLKSRIDNAVQMVEDIVEGVEKVAEEVDKIAEGIAKDMPEGQLKHLIKDVEHLAEKTAQTADALDNIIDKAQEAEEQVECIVESVVIGSSKKKIQDA